MVLENWIFNSKSFSWKWSKGCLCGSRKETVDKALSQLNKINSSYEVIGFSSNLLDLSEVRNMMEEVVNKWGAIDVLINNAGISDNVSIYNQDSDHFAKVIDINVEAVFNCSK